MTDFTAPQRELTLSREEREPSSRPLLVHKEISSQFCVGADSEVGSENGAVSELCLVEPRKNFSRISVFPGKTAKNRKKPEEFLPLSEREEIGDLLIEAGFSAMGGRFISCRQPSSELVFVCQNCNHVEIKPSSCNVRFCPRCNGRRFRILEEKFGNGISRMYAPIFLSLSYPNVSVLDRGALDYATRSFAKLRRARCFKNVRGGFYGLDVTFNAMSHTFNVHVHAVIDAPFLNRAQIYTRWLEITSDMGGKTRNVHIERAFFVDRATQRKVKWHPRLNGSAKRKILKSCSRYLIKHTVKAPNLPDASMLASFLMASYHKRLLQGFGSMFDLPPAAPRPMICSECGGSSWSFEGYAVILAMQGERLLNRPFRHYKCYSWDAG